MSTIVTQQRRLKNKRGIKMAIIGINELREARKLKAEVKDCELREIVRRQLREIKAELKRAQIKRVK